MPAVAFCPGRSMPRPGLVVGREFGWTRTRGRAVLGADVHRPRLLAWWGLWSCFPSRNTAPRTRYGQNFVFNGEVEAACIGSFQLHHFTVKGRSNAVWTVPPLSNSKSSNALNRLHIICNLRCLVVSPVRLMPVLAKCTASRLRQYASCETIYRLIDKDPHIV